MIQTQNFGQKIWDKLCVILKNILNAHFGIHFASPCCLNRIFIPNFVHYHFWFKIIQKLVYLL
jgi:hypothetical protein